MASIEMKPASQMQQRADLAFMKTGRIGKDVKMDNHVYKILELVGSSDKSIEDAIQSAVTRAKATIRGMRWFEVVQTRGYIENGAVRNYQVSLKVGFTIED